MIPVDAVAAHAGHLPGEWLAVLIVVSAAVLIVIATILDHRPPD